MSVPFEVIELDKPRKLRFATKAVKIAEELTGEKLLSLFAEQDVIAMDNLIKIAYAGLCWEDNELTLEKVEDILDEHVSNITSFVKKLSKAVSHAYEVKDAENRKEFNIDELIVDVVGYLGYTHEQFWDMTFAEINEAIEGYNKRRKLEKLENDFRTGLICSVIANVNRDKKKRRRPYTPQDFMPREKRQKMDAKQMFEVLKMVTIANGGKVNG